MLMEFEYVSLIKIVGLFFVCHPGLNLGLVCLRNMKSICYGLSTTLSIVLNHLDFDMILGLKFALSNNYSHSEECSSD